MNSKAAPRTKSRMNTFQLAKGSAVGDIDRIA
jgi:hypothetical protein